MKQNLPITEKTRVRRMTERANYDSAAIHAVLDDSLFGTIAFSDGTHVHAIPTAIWREHKHLYIHGSNGSRLLKILGQGASVCVSVTNVQGLVLARSAFHHSMNYHSVCIYGVFESVDPATKAQHMQYFFEHWMPERWQHVRAPDKNELAATTILRIPITEAVLKCRQGPPKDDAADMEQPVWAGVVPLQMNWQAPQQAKEQNNVNLPGQAVRVFVR